MRLDVYKRQLLSLKFIGMLPVFAIFIILLSFLRITKHLIGLVLSLIHIFIISVNNDENAPINAIADYVINGTVEEVIPKMIKYYKPVSYTHLDVYKRQHHGRPRTELRTLSRRQFFLTGRKFL